MARAAYDIDTRCPVTTGNARQPEIVHSREMRFSHTYLDQATCRINAVTNAHGLYDKGDPEQLMTSRLR
jgi:hypothetical protein